MQVNDDTMVVANKGKTTGREEMARRMDVLIGAPHSPPPASYTYVWCLVRDAASIFDLF